MNAVCLAGCVRLLQKLTTAQKCGLSLVIVIHALVSQPRSGALLAA